METAETAESLKEDLMAAEESLSHLAVSLESTKRDLRASEENAKRLSSQVRRALYAGVLRGRLGP